MRLFVCLLCLLQLSCATMASRASPGVPTTDRHHVYEMNFGERRIVDLVYNEKERFWKMSDSQRERYGVNYDDAFAVVILRDWQQNLQAEVARGQESHWLYIGNQPVVEVVWPTSPDPYLQMSCEARRWLKELEFRYRHLEFHVTCKRRVIN